MTTANGNLNDERKPVIGVTTGDPAGIGPEISLKAIQDPALHECCTPILIGDLEFLRSVARELSIEVKLTELDHGCVSGGGGVSVINVANIVGRVEPGVESELSGKASAEYIETSVTKWREGAIDAVATAPISKKALHLGGYNYPGHTEFYAKLTDTKDFAMSFFAEKLRVVLLSTHVSLRDAIELVTPTALERLIRFSERELGRLLGRKPRIAVAGVNPHASEEGLFGTEEAKMIAPAIEACRREGIDVQGPFSPDTIFLRGFRGEFDLVVACYHDQATIAVKSLSFGSSVNVTLGLPIIRTSVDHGTAFDIAGKGMADASSMKAAIKLAAEFVRTARPRSSV